MATISTKEQIMYIYIFYIYPSTQMMQSFISYFLFMYLKSFKLLDMHAHNVIIWSNTHVFIIKML